MRKLKKLWGKLMAEAAYHQSTRSPGLAVVSFGNPLRGDDAVADYIVRQLPEELLQDFSYYNLECNSTYIRNCIECRNATILIDAVQNNSSPGSCHTIDLNKVIRVGSRIDLRSSHALSWLDELTLLSFQIKLPTRLYFFGIEITDSDFSDTISENIVAARLEIVNKLAQLIRTCLKEMKTHA